MSQALRLLLLLALMLAPLGRLGMAEASAAPAASGHCAEMPAQRRGKAPQPDPVAIDCAMVCAATLTALPAPLPSMPLPVRAGTPRLLAHARLGGLHTDAELPPPRLS
jgi:hypothetical protein